VLDEIEQICQRARIEAIEVSHVLHGTTVATKVRAFVRPGHSSLWLNHERKNTISPMFTSALSITLTTPKEGSLGVVGPLTTVISPVGSS
jgi:hypothetical protein